MAMRHQLTNSGVIRVLVSDDTRVHTELLADALKRDHNLRVTSLSSGSAGLVARGDFRDTDILLISSNLDAQPGHGFEVLRGLRGSHRELKAVVILDTTDGPTILEAFKAGAQGIFTKNDSFEILGKCLRKVNEGQIWANGEQISILVEALASGHDIRAVDAKGLNLLSPREIQVVRGVAQGLSNREIAERLQLSQHTIKKFLFRIFDKLGVSSRVELLFMTLNQEWQVRSGRPSFVDETNSESLQDEAAMASCRAAAEQGRLMAQLMLADYYATNSADEKNAGRAYAWYSVLTERISQRQKELAKSLTTDQRLEAERMVGGADCQNGSTRTEREIECRTVSLRPSAAAVGPRIANQGVRRNFRSA
jgi:two-component system, NarL family, nitrate/nitrite response regulator NarL